MTVNPLFWLDVIEKTNTQTHCQNNIGKKEESELQNGFYQVSNIYTI